MNDEFDLFDEEPTKDLEETLEEVLPKTVTGRRRKKVAKSVNKTGEYSMAGDSTLEPVKEVRKDKKSEDKDKKVSPHSFEERKRRFLANEPI